MSFKRRRSRGHAGTKRRMFTTDATSRESDGEESIIAQNLKVRSERERKSALNLRRGLSVFSHKGGMGTTDTMRPTAPSSERKPVEEKKVEVLQEPTGTSQGLEGECEQRVSTLDRIQSCTQLLMSSLDKSTQALYTRRKSIEMFTEEKKKCEERLDTATKESELCKKRLKGLQLFLANIYDGTDCLRAKTRMINDSQEALKIIRKNLAHKIQEEQRSYLNDELACAREGNRVVITPNVARHLRMYDEMVQRSSTVDSYGRSMSEDDIIRAREARLRRARLCFIDQHSDSEYSIYADKGLIDRYAARELLLRSAYALIFDDVKPKYVSVEFYVSMFRSFALEFPDEYEATYGTDGLVSLCSCIIQFKMLDWSPLHGVELAANTWFMELVKAENFAPGFTTKIIENVVQPWVTWHIRNVWDPAATKQTTTLVSCLKKFKEMTCLSSISEAQRVLDSNIDALLIPVLSSSDGGVGEKGHLKSMQDKQLACGIKLLHAVCYFRALCAEDWVSESVERLVVSHLVPLEKTNGGILQRVRNELVDDFKLVIDKFVQV